MLLLYIDQNVRVDSVCLYSTIESTCIVKGYIYYVEWRGGSTVETVDALSDTVKRDRFETRCILLTQTFGSHICFFFLLVLL